MQDTPDCVEQQWLLQTPHWSYRHLTGPADTSLVLQTPHWSYRHLTGPADTSLVLQTPHWFYRHLTGSTDTSLVLQTPHWFYRHLTGPADTSLVLQTPHWSCRHLTGPTLPTSLVQSSSGYPLLEVEEDIASEVVVHRVLWLHPGRAACCCLLSTMRRVSSQADWTYCLLVLHLTKPQAVAIREIWME